MEFSTINHIRKTVQVKDRSPLMLSHHGNSFLLLSGNYISNQVPEFQDLPWAKVVCVSGQAKNHLVTWRTDTKSHLQTMYRVAGLSLSLIFALTEWGSVHNAWKKSYKEIIIQIWLYSVHLFLLFFNYFILSFYLSIYLFMLGSITCHSMYVSVCLSLSVLIYQSIYLSISMVYHIPFMRFFYELLGSVASFIKLPALISLNICLCLCFLFSSDFNYTSISMLDYWLSHTASKCVFLFHSFFVFSNLDIFIGVV